jgi:hypothetical protein
VLLTGHPEVYVSNDGHNGSTTLDAAPPDGWLSSGNGNAEEHANDLITAHPDALLVFFDHVGYQ